MNGNRLVVIQNGIKPQRVLGLTLDDSGFSVTEVRPMAVAQPEFDYPNYGTFKGEDFYFFANSQWPENAEAIKPVTVLRSPLNSAKELVPPDMRLYLEKQAKEQKAKEQEAARQKQEEQN